MYFYVKVAGIILGILASIAGIYFSASPSASFLAVNGNVSNTNITNSGNTEIEINFFKVQQELEKGIDKPTYRIEPHPSNEVVKDQVGGWFVIDLKDAASKELILFDIGKYHKDEFERTFRNSMMNVKADILKHIEAANVPYRLYVIGSADAIGKDQEYIGELKEGDPNVITFLKKHPNNPNQFIGQFKTKDIPKKYKNEDLPFLRASYIQSRLKDSTIREDSTILESKVTEEENEKDRNAMILLFVPEKSQAAKK